MSLGRIWHVSSCGLDVAWVELSRGRAGCGQLGASEVCGRRPNTGHSCEVESVCIVHTGERVLCRSGLLLGGFELVGSWAGQRWVNDIVGWLEEAWLVSNFVGRGC